jgi:anti-sigma regulatory factor (Ser/Thr protein kinase)
MDEQTMEDLSLHILDVSENAVDAGATKLWIVVQEDAARDLLSVEITDNGRGMDAGEKARALDPFYTTRTTRRIGLGLPLLRAAAIDANGHLDVLSSPGEGTTVIAKFQLSHIDRKPLGDIAGTLVALVAGRPELDLSYRHVRNERSIEFTTAELRRQLADIPVNSPEALRFLRDYVTQEENELHTHA